MDNNKRIWIWCLLLLILADLFILLNVPILRQTFGILAYLTIPGFLILLCLKTKEIISWKSLVYSIGLSVSFLIIAGLSVNLILPLLGITHPLALYNLLISFNFFILLLWFVAYSRNIQESKEKFEIKERMNLKSRIFFGIPFLFPLIAILGAYSLNVNPKSIIPMILIAIISLYVLLITLFNKDDISEKVFPFAIFMIAISLLFMVSLRSSHLFGCDIHGEYLVSQLTKDSLQWKSLNYAYNNSLSASLLPVILSSLLGAGEEIFFTLIAQILFAFVPLIIFLLLRKYIQPLYAFLAAFFFMSIDTFSMLLAIVRSEIAFLFVALSILVFFDEDVEKMAKRILFIVFASLIILSHYTVSYIYLGLMLSIAIVSLANKKDAKEYRSIITITTVFLFFAFIFFWCGQIISTPFNGFVGVIRDVVHNLINLFVAESRSEGALSAVSIPSGKILIQVSRYISLLMKLFIIIGFVYLFKKHKELQIEKEFIALLSYCLIFVLLSIILPVVTKEINIERVFLQSLMFLCVCCVIGAHFALEKLGLKERKINFLIAFSIILFFLFQSGLVFSIFNNLTSPALSDNSLAYKMWHVNGQEISASEWLAGQKPDSVYGDREALLRLWSYGRIIPHYALAEELPRGYSLTNSTTHEMLVNSYVFLRRDNVVSDSFMIKDAKENYIFIENFPYLLKNRNKVYDNKGTQVFR